MAKHPPRRRPKSEDSPKPPRPRLAEIQAEIHDVQQQIEQLRRAARVIRDAQDVRAWERAGPSRLFRKFVDTPGVIEITAKRIVVRLSKRAHNPLLKEAGLTRPTRAVPWRWGGDGFNPCALDDPNPKTRPAGCPPAGEARIVECRLGKLRLRENRRCWPTPHRPIMEIMFQQNELSRFDGSRRT